MIALFLTAALLGFTLSHAQQNASTTADSSMITQQKPFTSVGSFGVQKQPDQTPALRARSFIIAAAMITYGFISLENDGLKRLDEHIKEEIWTEEPHKTIKIDNYLQYAPAMGVYVLNTAGIKGKNNFRDRTFIYLMANAIMAVPVQSLKAITRIQRPDGFGTNAFPSGHTATAFVSAEFLRQEYKDVSPWYGVAGYAAAATTAYLRMYNNRHWFRDLLPGAGIGILSTKLAYWVYPAIKRKLFKDKPMNTVVMPYFQNKGGGVLLAYHF